MFKLKCDECGREIKAGDRWLNWSGIRAQCQPCALQSGYGYARFERDCSVMSVWANSDQRVRR
jgi:hypothetical protein